MPWRSTLRRRSIIVTFIVGAILLAWPAATRSDEATDRLAIKGYDPVAYFTERRPVPGKPEFELPWDGARWRFASAGHRDLFHADPDRYAPQYGGFCALGVAFGQKVEIDPEAWTIVDGKLYLNASNDYREQWQEDQATHIADADKNWPAVR
jgi:hypothetical protein